MRTVELLKALENAKDFDTLCQRYDQEFMDDSLIAYLFTLLERHDTSKRQMMVKADLEKGYAYQILRGIRIPSRDKLIQIALGLSCSVEETQMLLRLAGRNELYARVKRDAAILYCLLHRYRLVDCQCFLETRHYNPLKE